MALALDAPTLHAVLSAWSLGALLRVEQALGGATNQVYRVESSSGVAFLRRYKRPSVELVLREHALIQRVRAAGLPAPAPIALAAGGSVLAHPAGVFALYESARGRQLSASELTPAHARAAGEMLARLHAVLEPLPDVGYLRWVLSWDGPEWVERLNVVERALLAGLSASGSGREPAASESDRMALERVRAQRAWLSSPACRHSWVPAFAAQVTHGDYQDANLFFDGDAVSAVIDWEQAAFTPRAYEVVRACSFIGRFEPARTRAFVAAYMRHSGMAEPELADGARAWGCFSDHHVWSVEEVYLNGNPAARRYFKPFRPFEQAWAAALGAPPGGVLA